MKLTCRLVIRYIIYYRVGNIYRALMVNLVINLSQGNQERTTDETNEWTMNLDNFGNEIIIVK